MLTRRLLFCILLLTVFALPVYAQDDPREIVMTAVEAMAELDSYHITTEQILDQSVSFSMNGQTSSTSTRLEQTMEADYQRDGDDYNFIVTLEQQVVVDMMGSKTEVEMTMEMIVVDDEFYLRFTDVSESLESLVDPDEWLTSDNIADNPLTAMINPDGFSAQITNPVIYPITEETVTDVEERDSDEIDGVEVRVFDLEFDTEALAESDAIQALLGAFNTSGMGVDMEDMMRQMMRNAELELTFYIGVEDGLLYQTESALSVDGPIEISGTEVDFVQSVQNTTRFSAFNEEVEIEAPED
jgi:hypothetical protein